MSWEDWEKGPSYIRVGVYDDEAKALRDANVLREAGIPIEVDDSRRPSRSSRDTWAAPGASSSASCGRTSIALGRS
jgi:hypothetical protein